MQHVPYKGASDAVADLIAGHIHAVSTTLTTAATQIRAGKSRALAISSAARLPDYPEVPTFAELGYPELVATIWFSLSGPPGMPPDIVQPAERRSAAHPATARRARAAAPRGIEPGDLDPQAFTAFVAAEVKRWGPVVRAGGRDDRVLMERRNR